MIMYVVWPLAAVSFGFAYLMYRGVPEYYRQVSHPINISHPADAGRYRHMCLTFSALCSGGNLSYGSSSPKSSATIG